MKNLLSFDSENEEEEQSQKPRYTDFDIQQMLLHDIRIQIQQLEQHIRQPVDLIKLQELHAIRLELTYSI